MDKFAVYLGKVACLLYVGKSSHKLHTASIGVMSLILWSSLTNGPFMKLKFPDNAGSYVQCIYLGISIMDTNRPIPSPIGSSTI